MIIPIKKTNKPVRESTPASPLYKKVTFIHIPKTAGSSLRGGLNPILSFTQKNWHLTAQNLLEKYNIRNTFVFTFVRNPYDRFVSFYHYFRDHIDRGDFHDRIKKETREKTFTEFCLSFNSISQRYPAKWVIFFQPQYVYIKSIIPNFIGKYEHIQKDWKTLLNLINTQTALKVDFSTSLEHRNKSKHKHYLEYYTPEIKKIVYDFYKTDFKIFGYSKDF